MSVTVDELVRKIRFKVQEANTSQVSDEVILDKLNLAKNYAYDKLAKHYMDPLLEYVEIDTNEQEIDIPETAFGDRVVKIEYLEKGTGRWPVVRRTTFRELGKVSSNNTRQFPDVWATRKRKIRFSSPFNTQKLRIWFIKDIGELVLQQGRIDSVVQSTEGPPATRPFVTVDKIGSDLSVSDSYKKYVSVIDSTTGEVKVSLQLEELNDNTQVIFKTTPTRSEVTNIPVSGESVLDETEDPQVELDDYICTLGGTCVIYFAQPMINLMIQYAANEIREDLGTIKSGQDGKLNKFENDLISTEAGRETTKRVQNRSAIWRAGKLRRNYRK